MCTTYVVPPARLCQSWIILCTAWPKDPRMRVQSVDPILARHHLPFDNNKFYILVNMQKLELNKYITKYKWIMNRCNCKGIRQKGGAAKRKPPHPICTAEEPPPNNPQWTLLSVLLHYPIRLSRMCSWSLLSYCLSC